MSAYVQLVDPGGRFEHAEGTLTHDAVLRLPLDKQVKSGLAGRILRKVDAPAEAPAAEAPVADKSEPASSPEKSEPAEVTSPEKPAEAAPAAAPKTTTKTRPTAGS